MTPEFVRVRARDVKPYLYAVWCSIEGGEPFSNPICHIEQSEDGSKLYFLLDTHNCVRYDADAELELVVNEPCPAERAFAESWAGPRVAR